MNTFLEISVFLPAGFKLDTVCVIILLQNNNLFNTLDQSSEYLPEVSATLKTCQKNDISHQFLHDMAESFVMMGATLALIHPSLFAAGMDAMAKMAAGLVKCKEPDLVKEVMEVWPLPFNTFSIISNRQTVPHHDVQGMLPNYNLLATFGSYNDGHFEVPALGMRFIYNPGTLLGISGKVLIHGVASVSGNRVCIANYFREKVMERIGMHVTGYTMRQDFEQQFIDITKHSNE